MHTAKKHFKKIAVIGAGTMGSGIAAQIANAGLDVTLIDLAAKDENAIPPAELAIKRLIKSEQKKAKHPCNESCTDYTTQDNQ